MMQRNRAMDTFPVKFVRDDAGNYAIWDRGGPPGDRLGGFAEVGAITRLEPGNWAVTVDGQWTRQNLPGIVAAKSLYLLSRPHPLDPQQYVPQSEPDPPRCVVRVPMSQWEAADEWRSKVYRAMAKRNNPAAINIMLTPLEMDWDSRTYILNLPTMVAQDLLDWLERTA